MTQSTTANQAEPAGSQAAQSSALRLLAGGLVATAAAFVIQTAVYRVVDDDAFSATLAGVDFALADGAVLVALIRLAAAAELRPYAASAAALTGLLALGDGVAVAAHIAGRAPEWLRLLDAAQGHADPPIRAGSTLLVLFALWVLARGHRLRASSVAVAWTVPVALVLSTGLSFVGSVAEGGRSVAMAWIGWLLVVARPVALAALAFAVLRARERASPAVGPPPQTAYRQPGASPAPAHSPPTVGEAPFLAAAASGLRTLRRVTLARMLLTAGMVGVVLSAVDGSPPAFPFAGVALLSAATSLPLLVGLGRVLPLARSAGARARVGVAMGLRALGCLFDVTAFLGIAMSSRAEPMGPVWLLEAISVGVVASLLVASAMAAIGRCLGSPAVVRDARWVLATLLVAVGLTLGAAFVADGDHGSAEGLFVCCVIVMCAAAFAVQRLQARLAGKAGAALAADLARASAG